MISQKESKQIRIGQFREVEHSNWLYHTIVQLNHLFLVEISLFSTRAFSELHFFLFNLTFKAYSSSAGTYNKITII